MMNIRPYKLPCCPMWMSAIVISALFLLSSCKYLPDFLNVDSDKSGYFDIHDIQFSDDLSKIRITCIDLKDAPEMVDVDSIKNRILRVKTLNYRGLPSIISSQPIVAGVDWTGCDNIKEADICMMALIDLTRPEQELAKAKVMLKRYKKTFGDNLFLTFMLPQGQISYTMPATDYALDVYISHSSLKSRLSDIESIDDKSYLYTGVSALLERLADKETHTYLDTTAHTTVAIFSSEDVYDSESNYPYDPRHFEIQDKLLNQIKDIPSGVSVFFLDGYQSDNGDEDEQEYSSSIFDVICNSTGGQYLRDFNTVSFLRMVMDQYDVFVPDFEIFLDNPIGNIYYGKVNRLKVDICSSNDSLLATASKEFRVADIYHPVIVGGISKSSIWLRGTARAFSLLFLVYLTLQLIIPSFKYKLFHRKHVVEYKGPRQTHNGISLPDTCYLCKGTFVPGDKVVAKCVHVVHEECWDENGQHCPEYGISCQIGSHFYDKKHPYNFRNAPFFTEWVLLAILVAWITWSMFLFIPGTGGYRVVDMIVNYLVDRIDAISISSIDVLSSRQYLLTLFSFNMAFFSTMVGSLLSVHRRKINHFIFDVLIRSSVAGVLVFFLFGVQCAFFVAMKKYEPFFLLEVIPWTVSILIVEYISTYKTNFRPNHRKFLYSAIVLSVIVTLLLIPSLSLDSDKQYVRMVFGYVVFFVGITFVLSRPDRKNRHPYLSASGSFKEMDIALYKWFLLNPNTIVTIGRSVDCSINLFVDLVGDIAPVHCSIKHLNDTDVLCISDNDVELNGRKAKYHKAYRLYYGDVFKVGNVKFRYHGI